MQCVLSSEREDVSRAGAAYRRVDRESQLGAVALHLLLFVSPVAAGSLGATLRELGTTGRGGPNGEGAFISHKTRHAALRYFVCLHVRDPIIVAAGGGYPAGHFVDITIARRDIVPAMLPQERGIADGGYYDFSHFMPPLRANALVRNQVHPVILAAYHQALQAVRARQEHINAEITEWGIMSQRFRGNLHFHPTCFQAVVQLTQLRLELSPSILSAPQYAPVLIGGSLHVFQFNKDGSVAGSCQL